jgi:hypothetical protein
MKRARSSGRSTIAIRRRSPRSAIVWGPWSRTTITHFRGLSNEKALQLTGDYLAAEADRLQVRRAYLAEFAKILPGRAVARFYQIENKMDAVLRYDLAATIPVVEPQSGAPRK